MAYKPKSKQEQEEQNMFIRATRSIISSNGTLDVLFRDSMLIYDQALYYLRQEYFRCRDLEWKETPVYPSWMQLYYLVKETEAWKNSKLDINPKNQAVKSASSAWNSWLKAKEDYKKNPGKYTGEPKMPRYMYRFTDWHEIRINKTRFRGTDEKKIRIPCTKIELDVPSNLKKEWITEIVLSKNCGNVSVSYVYDLRKTGKYREMLEAMENKKPGTILAIDIGKVNIATGMTFGCGENDGSFLIRGKYFTQKIDETTEHIASLESDAMTSKNKEVTKISKRDGQLKLCKNTHQMNAIWSSYGCFVDNQIGNISSMIIDYCKERNIEMIVIGYNKDWKQNIELGRKNNREFCHIPHKRLLDTVKMKAEVLGIEFMTVEESHTSKTDHMAGEAMCHHEHYLGRRVSRGKFISSTGKIIHADVNGCIGIIRKANVIPDAELIEGLRDRGDVVSPVVLNVRGINPRRQRSSKITEQKA